MVAENKEVKIDDVEDEKTSVGIGLSCEADEHGDVVYGVEAVFGEEVFNGLVGVEQNDEIVAEKESQVEYQNDAY